LFPSPLVSPLPRKGIDQVNNNPSSKYWGRDWACTESAVEVKREKKIIIAPSKDNKYTGLRWNHNVPRTRKPNMATKRGYREPVDVNSNGQVDLRRAIGLITVEQSK
jgi:hypothetical protein